MLNMAAAPLQINCSSCRNKVSGISLTLPSTDLLRATSFFLFCFLCYNTLVFLSAYLQSQLLDVSEQLDIFFRQVFVTRQFLIFITPVAAFLIV